MKKYFNGADIIVFTVSIVSFIWICLYKLWFTTSYFTEPLFYNADRIADIVYTIFTSILASGIFYLFTIFAPKYFQIRKMKPQMLYYAKGLDIFTDAIIGSINIDDTSNKYEMKDFKERVFVNKNKDPKNINKDKEVVNDFINCYEKPMYEKNFVDFIATQMRIFDCIILTYANQLPHNLTLSIINLMKLNMDFVNSPFKDDLNKKEQCKLYFSTLIKILQISDAIKKIYK